MSELLTRDQPVFMLNLVHDEYLENVMAGHEEVYQEWAAFAVWCIAKIVIPVQRHGSL